MTEPTNPGLQEALATLTPANEVLENEHRSQKLQEISNLVVSAATTVASELKAFQPAESGFSFDLANLTWSGSVWLMHSSIPTIFAKPTFTARYVDNDNIALSAHGAEGDAGTQAEDEQELLNLPAGEINQTNVTDAVRKYFEPHLMAAINEHDELK